MPVRPILLALLTATALPAAAQLSAQPGSSAPLAPGLNYVAPLGPAAITQIQDRLRAAGDYTGRVDGVWGPDSQAALERFQGRNGLQATGVMNPGTVATLRLTPNDLFGIPSPAPVPAAIAVPRPPEPEPIPGPTAAPIPFTPAVVRNIQASLRGLGFYAGVVDGVWGPFTQSALVRFQTSRRIPADGQLTPATLQSLGLDPQNPSAPPR